MVTDDLIEAGLCAGCAHARVIRSDRGSRFWLCRRAARDEAYPRYPRLPVLTCAGHEPAAAATAGDRDDG